MGSNPGSFLQKYCLNFHKMNRCHYLLEHVVVIPLYPNVIHIAIADNSLKETISSQIGTQHIGRSRGGMPGTRPPMGPNSFIFAYIFAEKHPHQRSTSPLTGPCPPTGNHGSATATTKYLAHWLLFCAKF